MNPDLISKSRFAASAIAPPNIIAERISADIDSKRSAHCPAQSPTLSPTKSAITAGFLASSSGIPCSTLPIRSAPTSAAFVKIPPPSYANIATKDAPNPNPTSITGISWMGGSLESGALRKKIRLISKNMNDIPNIASATLMIAANAPPLKHICNESL